MHAPPRRRAEKMNKFRGFRRVFRHAHTDVFDRRSKSVHRRGGRTKPDHVALREKDDC
jgi:hypothetical protein